MKTAIIISGVYLALAIFNYTINETCQYIGYFIASQIWTATAAILIELNKQRRDR